MNLKSLSLKNIRSYQSEDIHFPKGSTLLSGDVGSGKTTILLAIEHALFGLQPGQRGSALLANGKDEGTIILELEIEDKIVVIERTLKRSSKGINQDYAAITIDGTKEEMSVTELKTRILGLLNYPEEFVKKTNLLYRYTVYAPQEAMKEIITEDAESRLDILRHIFGIDKYRRIKDNILLVTLRLRDQVRSLQFEVKDLEEHYAKREETKSKVLDLHKKIEEKKALVEEQKKARKALEVELASLETKVAEKQRFEKEIEKTNVLLSNKIQYSNEQEMQIKQLRAKIAEESSLFNEIEYQTILASIQESKNAIEKQQGILIDLTGKLRSHTMKKQEENEKKERISNLHVCPTCLQDVSENHKHTILLDTDKKIFTSQEEITKLIVEVQTANRQIEDSKATLRILEKKKSDLEFLRIKTHEINLAKSKIEDLLKLRESMNKDLDVLNAHIALLKESVLAFSKFANLSRLKEGDLKKAFEQEKKIEIEIAGIEKERELTIKAIETSTEEIKKKEKIKADLAHLSGLEKWLNNDFASLITSAERNIMIKLRHEFSKLFNKWFSMLTTDAFYVQLDENFSPIILQGDYELDYSYLSGGERTAVALAYRLALNQIINSLLSNIKTRDLIILDEPTDGFSDQQLDKIRDILQELDVKQLIIVSHEQKIESFVDNIIKIRKLGGQSTKD